MTHRVFIEKGIPRMENLINPLSRENCSLCMQSKTEHENNASMTQARKPQVTWN
jgi:hypothetical protein